MTDIEYLDFVPDEGQEYANNAPKYDYKCKQCGFRCESHIREQLIWSCPICTETTPLYRTYDHAPNMWRVWHGHDNLTTGQVVTDRKQFKEQLHVAQEEATERFGFQHSFIEVDPNDKDSIGVNDSGLDSTHDKHVELGWKESKGTFVFPLSANKPTTPKA